MNQRSRMLVSAMVASMMLAACGGSAADTADAGQAASAASGASTPLGVFNLADVTFAQSMIPHHEQAIEMADIALDPNVQAGEQIQELATQIRAAQDPEVGLMTDWLVAWEKPLEMDTSDGHDHSAMEGMMTPAQMENLDTLTGAAFDKEWAAMMIAHHEGAISMAKDVTANGSSPDVKQLAVTIMSTQAAEIELLKPLA